MPAIAYIQPFDAPSSAGGLPVWSPDAVGLLASPCGGFAAFSAERNPRVGDTGRPAYRGPQWQDAYFSRIHAFPASVDVGLISGATVATFTFWNASETQTVITAVSATGGEGVGVSGLSLPAVLQPTEERKIVVVIEESGLPVIDAALTFQTSHGPVTIHITGLRGVIIPHEPDWSEPVEVGRFFRTVRTSALSTREERRAMASLPLRRISYTVTCLGAAETERLKQAVLGVGDRLVGVPLWTEKTRCHAAIEPSAITFPVDDTGGRRIAPGDIAIIWAGPAEWALREIESVLATTIIIRQAVGRAFPRGAWIAPVCTGRLTALPDFEQLTDEIAKAQIDFEEQP